MSQLPHLYSRCLKKKRYRDEYEAERQARRCMLERPGRVLRNYYCTTCCGFHLTSMRETEQHEELSADE